MMKIMTQPQSINIQMSRSAMITSYIKYKIPFQGERIQQLEVASDRTFVILSSTYDGIKSNFNQSQWINHLDENGQIINSFHFRGVSTSFVLTDNQEVIIPLIKQNLINVMNLKHKTNEQVYFKFSNYKNPLQLFWFSKSKYICMMEDEFSEIVLTYFQIVGGELRVILSYKTKKYDSQNQYFEKTTFKGNMESLMIFVNKRQNEVVLFDVVSINKCEELRIRRVKTARYEKYIDFWQVTKGWLSFVPESRYYYKKIREVNIENGEVKFSNLELPTNKNKLDLYIIEHTYNFMQDFICLSERYSYRKKYGRMLRMIFINKDNWQVVSEEEGEEGGGKLGAMGRVVGVCDCDQSMFFRSVFEEDNKMIVLKVIKPMVLKQVYMLFLQHLNEDFDDDLLLDAIDILDCL